jgi:Bacteriocin-protection, YdeI or OmpD-Associated/Domain of unknown function (DUF1905)
MAQAARRVKFRTTIITAGKTATGIEIPPEIIDAMNSGKRPPVKITINNKTYRSTVAVMGGQYMVGVSAQNRDLTGVAGGDEVDVYIELDTEPREVAIPEDLAKALKADPTTKQFWATLTPSQQGAQVATIESAKTAETRARRIDKTMAMLGERRKS